MTSSRVGDVRVQLRLPANLGADAARIQAQVEQQLVVGVLEELERRLHAALGGDAVIHVRHLSLRWQLGATELGDATVVERLAEELARDLLSELGDQPSSERLRPMSAVIVAFADRHHAAAAWLADAADGRSDHWFYASRADVATTWTELVAEGPPALQATIGWLQRMERMTATIERAPEAALVALAALSPELAGEVALVRARQAVAGRPTQIGEVSVTDAAATPTLNVTTAVTVAPDTTVVVDAPTAAAPIVAAGPTVDTAHAGLFYLVGRVLEIDLAERLWAAGIPEGALLAQVARAVIAADDDPAWRWFGRDFDGALPSPRVSAWAADEIANEVQHALGRRLVQLGVTTTPAQLAARLDALAAALPSLPSLDPTTTVLVRRSAAALAVVVAARLGERATWPLLHAVTRRPGRLVLTTDAVRVVMPASAIDVDHRRAGLDHDPGHVAWLGRRVAIEFVGGEAL